MRKVMLGSIVLALLVGACTRPAPTPVDQLKADLRSGSYGTLTADRSEPAKAYYQELMASAGKLVSYSHDPEGQALFDFMKGRTVLVPLAPSVPRVGIASRGALELPVILVGRSDYGSPDGFWGAVLAGGDAKDVEITAGRFWYGLSVFILRSNLQPDGWTASIMLHEARHAMDTQQRGDFFNKQEHHWEGERRAYDLQTRLIRAWGGAPFEKWVVKLEQERVDRGLDLTGAGSGRTPTPYDMKRWLGELEKIFGPIQSDPLNALSFTLMCVNFRGKSELQREEVVKAIYGILGF